MNIKYYLKDAWTNENSKDTNAIISYKGRIFSGHAFMHPEDKEKYSYLFGCSLAEMRAVLNAVRNEIYKLQYQIKIKENFLKAAENCKNFDKNSSTAKTMLHLLNIDKKNLKMLKTTKAQIKENIKTTIELQEEKNKRLENLLKRKKAEAEKEDNN